MKAVQFVVTLLFMAGLMLADQRQAPVVLVLQFVWLLAEARGASVKYRLMAERLLASWMLVVAINGIITSAAIAKNAQSWAHVGEALLAVSCVGFAGVILGSSSSSRSRSKQKPAVSKEAAAAASAPPSPPPPVLPESVALLSVEVEPPLVFDGVVSSE